MTGKAFHTFTKGFNKPFDDILTQTMNQTAQYLCQNIQGCKLAYTQSDEISLLLTDYEKITTSAWFDNNIQKMVSISASMTTMIFNKIFSETVLKYENFIDDEIDLYVSKFNTAMFDSRVFTLPKEEVCNYFIWRQQDATKNSIQMFGRSEFSHKELQNKNCNEIQDMLFVEKGLNWNNAPVYQKRGTCIIKEKYVLKGGFENQIITERPRWVIDLEIPIFTQNREYIESLL